MSLHDASKSSPLQLNKDMHMKETTNSNGSAMNAQTKFVSNAISYQNEDVSINKNHNPLLEDRLKPSDGANNSGISICSVDDRGGVCCEQVNGIALNMNRSDCDNLTQKQSPVSPEAICDSDVKVGETPLQCVSDCDSTTLPPLTPLRESDNVATESDGAQETDKSSVLSNNDNSFDVEILKGQLENTSLTDNSTVKEVDVIDGLTYVVYESEKQMPDIMRLITKDLSEPYSIYTYRYFIHNWPKLCFLAMDGDTCVGAIVCKLDLHKKMVRRGYIAMLAVDSAYRRRKLGSTLVTKAIKAMIRDDCDEVVLETEITNQAALRLYENLGFVRDKRLFRYYLNGVDALRLKLWLR